MLAQERGGVIINIASLLSNVNWMGMPSCFVYTATKGAVHDRAHERQVLPLKEFGPMPFPRAQ